MRNDRFVTTTERDIWCLFGVCRRLLAGPLQITCLMATALYVQVVRRQFGCSFRPTPLGQSPPTGYGEQLNKHIAYIYPAPNKQEGLLRRGGRRIASCFGAKQN